MAHPALRDKLRAILAGVDPRRSLGAAAIWLIVALAATFSIAAAIWVGSIARRSVLEQHIRRLALETDQLGSDLGQAMAARLGAVRASGRDGAGGRQARGQFGAVFEELTAAYPSLDWIAAADAKGMIVASQRAQDIGSEVATAPWFSSGIRAPWLGVAGEFASLRLRDFGSLRQSRRSRHTSSRTGRIPLRESSSRTFAGAGPRITRSGSRMSPIREPARKFA